MKRDVFANLTGEQVEIFLTPNMPYTTGVLTSCDDDFVMIDGDEIWSYRAILGLRTAHGRISRRAEPPAPEPLKQAVNTVSTEKPKEAAPAPIEQVVETASTDKPKEAPVPVKQAVDTVSADVPKEVPAPTPAPAKDTQTVKEELKKGEKKQEAKVPEIKLPDREFTGVLSEFYHNRRWGFIRSKEVVKAGVPLRDGEKVFVHLNQISDNLLRKRLLDEKIEAPDIEVTFRLIRNQRGIAADEVRTATHVKIADILPPGVSIIPIEEEKPKPDKEEAKPKETKSSAEAPTEAPAETPAEAPVSNEKEEGEIDYYSRYATIPHGEIRMKGNTLLRFDYDDVIDPILNVFLEVSPSAEGQAVKFVKKTLANGKYKATNVEAAVPFPEERIKEWEKSGLLKKKESK